MDGWANKFKFGDLIVSYSTYEQGWEVIQKRGEHEVSFRWFPSLEKAQAFAYGKIKGVI